MARRWGPKSRFNRLPGVIVAHPDTPPIDNTRVSTATRQGRAGRRESRARRASHAEQHVLKCRSHNRRHLRSNNTWLHNVPALMKGRDRCTLLVHPDDAARCGITDGDVVTVKSAAGEIKVPVEVTDAIKPGVVSMPHGWGHGKPGTRMSVANGSPGANTNVLSRRRSSTSRPATVPSTASR